MENVEKKCSNSVLVIILLILVIGLSGFVAYDKLLNKSDNKITKCEKELNALKKEKNTTTKENTTTEEDTTKNESSTTEVDDTKYTEKMYSSGNSKITLFKSGNCVVASGYEYTAKCKYYVENNILYITRQNAGIGDGSESTSTYNIIVDGNEEYIELSTNKNERLKLLK